MDNIKPIDQSTIYDIVRCGPYWLCLVVELLQSTCMTIGELCGTQARYTTKQGECITNRRGLILEDVLDDQTWNPDADQETTACIKCHIEVTGMGGKTRVIALNARARRAIVDMIRDQFGMPDTYRMGNQDDRLCPYSRTYVAAQFNAAKKKAGIEDKITLSTISNHSIAKLMQAGFIREAQAQSGQSFLRKPIDANINISLEQQQEAMRILNE